MVKKPVVAFSACLATVLLLIFTAPQSFCNADPAQRRTKVLDAIRAGEEGFPVLRKALEDEDALVRGTAARGLARAGEPAAEILAEALGNEDSSVRRIAFAALHNMDKLTDEQLVAAGSDADEDIRQLAVGYIDILERWNFLPDIPREEYAPVAEFRGRTILAADGPSGICIKTFPGQPIETGRQGVLVANHPALSPEGGFTIEMWVKPDPRWVLREGPLADYQRGNLVDKKYIRDQHATLENHNDYKIYVRTLGASFRVEAWLGFGDESDRFASDSISFEPGKWHHFAFTYDGEGEARFYLDGKYVGGDVREGRGSITHGQKHFSYLIIGDRISDSRGFPGWIDSVRIHHRVVEPVLSE